MEFDAEDYPGVVDPNLAETQVHDLVADAGPEIDDLTVLTNEDAEWASKVFGHDHALQIHRA